MATHQQQEHPDAVAIRRAADLCGSMVGLAKRLGVSYQAVQKWRRTGRAPAERCVGIEQATNGAVTRYDLRPDVFGAAPATLQEAG